MPWQIDLFNLIGEMHQDPETGLWVPAYGEVFYTVPRQSGKTVGLLTFCVDRNLNWSRSTNVVWTAQDGSAARGKWIREIFPRLEDPKRNELYPLWDRGMKGKGDEAAIWKNGSRIDLLGKSKTAGHGDTIDAYVLDELFADEDDNRAQALDPAMATIADGQALLCSTAGEQWSTVYNQKVRLGRRAVEADSGEGMAYIEYSAPDGWDPEDEASYWGFMPALGHNRAGGGGLTLRKVRQARTVTFAENPDGFRRAYGNRPPSDDGGVLGGFEQVCYENVCPDPDEGLWIGVAVSQDRTMAAIAVADSKGRVELVEYRPGTGWVVDEANKAARVGNVVLDLGGPAGSLADSIDGCTKWGAGDVVRACGAFHDAVVEREGLSVRTNPLLSKATEGLVKRPVGDAFVWSRKASANDVTPLEAATIAWAAARHDDSLDVFAF